MRSRLAPAVGLTATLLLGACGGLSDVGDQPQTVPGVEAAAVNHAFTRDAATGKITVTVRSGSEVVLSGKGSEGVVAPILKFEWTAQNAAARAATVIRRNANTISFNAPSGDSPLQFRLTVTDSNGQTSSADADVNVVPIADPNRFLTYLDAPTTFTVVPMTDVPVTPAQMSGDVPFSVSLVRQVSYLDLDGRPQMVSLPAQTITGTWFRTYGTSDASGGAGTSCGGFPNPRLSVAVPPIEADEIAVLVQDSQPSRAINPASIDQVSVGVTLTIALTGTTATNQLPVGRSAVICLEDGAGALMASTIESTSGARIQNANPSGENVIAAATIRRDASELAGPSTISADTAESADAYYATIDTALAAQQKSTFLGWLKANGFVADSAQNIAWADVAAGSTAQAVYVNNFDLGFGRDMYARRFNCAPGTPAPGQCDVAAVVVNYASLEGAAKKTNPIVAVAMEYSVAPESNGQRIVKFYTFAPNLTSGEFLRVRSVDLDRRGEKYMPGACTVCHGGTPGGALAAGRYPNGGNVQSGFLPWDLDSLLYSDTDGNFSTRAEDAALRSRFTRTAQEAQLKQLNALAYLTYHDPTTTLFDDVAQQEVPGVQVGRFALARQLVEGWYGGPGLPADRFTAFVPPQWMPRGIDGVAGTADDNAPDSDVVYRDHFSKYCRSCHIIQSVPTILSRRVSGSWDPRLSPACTSDTAPDVSVSAHQLPMGCYRQFVRSPNLAERLANAEMPLARLSTDRLWVPGSGSTNPGDALIRHLTDRFTAMGDTASLQMLSKPGAAVARIRRVTGGSTPLDIGDRLEADGTTTTSATGFAWTLERCQSSTSTIPACRSTSAPPIDSSALSCSAAPEGVLMADQPSASVVLGAASIYRLSLTANPGANTASQLLNVPRWTPCAQPDAGTVDPQNLGSTTVGVPVPLIFDNIVNRGNGSAAQHTIQVSVSGTSVPVQVNPATCATQACPAGSAITLTPTAVGQASVNLHVVDTDGDAADIPVTFVSESSLTAQTFSTFTFAITDLPIVIPGASNDVAIEIIQQVCPDDQVARDVCLLSANGTRASIISPTTTGFTYRPPSSFSTQRRGDLTDRLAPEVIQYRLRSQINPADVSAPATITIRIRATASFTEAVDVFAPCTSCHNGATAPDYPNFPYRDEDASVNQWRLGNIGSGRARVNLSNPEESGLVCWPTRSCPTPSTDLQHIAGLDRTDDELAPILNWIRSGANNDVDPP